MARREPMVYADEVAATLGVAKGYVTVSGRLPRRYWEEKFYGGAEALYGEKE